MRELRERVSLIARLSIYMSPAARVSPLCSLGLGSLAAAPRTRPSDPRTLLSLDTHDTHDTDSDSVCVSVSTFCTALKVNGGPVESGVTLCVLSELAPTRSTATCERGGWGGCETTATNTGDSGTPATYLAPPPEPCRGSPQRYTPPTK